MRCVCFYSDFGVVDEFAGTCRAVIARVAPLVSVIDITHGIARHDILGGALVLQHSLPYTPDRAVHLAVVDPGVGGPRRPIALRTADDRVFVGPDNGLLMPAAEAAGGVVEAVELTNRGLWLMPASETFHGRDVFAPVAARLAEGLTLPAAGATLDSGSLVRLAPPLPRRQGNDILAVVVRVDAFGNAALNLAARDLAGLPGGIIQVDAPGGSVIARAGTTFGSVPAGESVVFVDSSGYVAIAVNGGSVADLLRLAPGVAVRLQPRTGAPAA